MNRWLNEIAAADTKKPSKRPKPNHELLIYHTSLEKIVPVEKQL